MPASLMVMLVLTGCQSTKETGRTLKVESSYLESGLAQKEKLERGNAKKDKVASPRSAFAYLKQLNFDENNNNKQALQSGFSETDTVTISSDNLAVKDFLHYVFGELLGVSYIVGELNSAETQKLTLNLQKPISKRKLFVLSEQLLNQKGLIIRESDGIYYIHQSTDGGKSDIAFGYGNSPASIPNTAKDIIQYVPYQYGSQVGIIGTINNLFNVTANPISQKNAMSIKGKRVELLKVLDFISMLDRPSLATKQVALYSPIYRSIAELNEELESLLKEDGISYSSKGAAGKAVSSVLLERSGKMVLFATNKNALDRVEYWLERLDKPHKGSDKKYHIYQPSFARATDLGLSLSSLIGGRVTGADRVSNSTSAERENSATTPSNTGNGSLTAANADIRLVVDERSNSLIIESDGEKYRELLPLIKRLDVMPKQVMLEVVIAEVQLSGAFEQGIEFALTNRFSNSTRGNGLLSGASGTLNYILRGADGNLTLNFLETNTNVDILSRPSIVVRDGVSATMNAGDSVPTVGKIVTDPTTGSQQSIEYRKTGIQLTVTPTINAQGVVIMEITQTTSNTADGSSTVDGAPIFTERTITTEAVAASGQTVVLGGLIRENKTTNDNSVPFFSDLPILGKLFEGKKRSKDKVELVVMVTPKVIESAESWEDIRGKFLSGFQLLQVSQQ